MLHTKCRINNGVREFLQTVSYCKQLNPNYTGKKKYTFVVNVRYYANLCFNF